MAIGAFLAAGCAAHLRPPAPGVPERARETTSCSARVRVSLKGPSLRGRTWAIVAFSRPSSLRIEVPGSRGAELLAVTRAGELTAVFPSERAVYQGPASRDTLEYLLGVGLLPGEVIDLLVGVEPAGLHDYRVGWGGALPERIRATLRDGAKLELLIEEPVTDPPVPEAAFEPPPHPGYRPVELPEARELWSRR